MTMRPTPTTSKVPSSETSNNTDDSNYGSALLPGVMLTCSANVGGELLTTSLLLVSPTGERYITVALHGFPRTSELIYHPTGHGQVIGRIYQKLDNTGISLAQLDPGLTYSIEPFQSIKDTGPNPIIQELRDPESVQMGDHAFLDSLFSGSCNGVILGSHFWKWQGSISGLPVMSSTPATAERMLLKGATAPSPGTTKGERWASIGSPCLTTPSWPFRCSSKPNHLRLSTSKEGDTMHRPLSHITGPTTANLPTYIHHPLLPSLSALLLLSDISIYHSKTGGISCSHD